MRFLLLLFLFCHYVCSVAGNICEKDKILPFIELLEINSIIPFDEFVSTDPKHLSMVYPDHIVELNSEHLGIIIDTKKDRIVSLTIGAKLSSQLKSYDKEKTANILYEYIKTLTGYEFKFIGSEKDKHTKFIKFKWQRIQDGYLFLDDHIQIYFDKSGKFHSFSLRDFSNSCDVNVVYDTKKKALNMVKPKLNELFKDKCVITKCVEVPASTMGLTSFNGKLRISRCNDYFKDGRWSYSYNEWEQFFKFSPKTRLAWGFVVKVKYYEVSSKSFGRIIWDKLTRNYKERVIGVTIDAETGTITGGIDYTPD